MQLSDVLTEAEIDPKCVLVFRHRPKEPGLRKVLPWLAVDRHEVFNAYQQTQGPKVEEAIKKAKYVASFIGHEPGKAVFVGLYDVGQHHRLSYDQLMKKREQRELMEFGATGPTPGSHVPLWFDLNRRETVAEWQGKLIIQWPGKELSWWRWAGQNTFTIHAILVESILVRDMPDWKELVVTWNELAAVPKKWQDALRQWRGVYFIFDIAQGKGYVGAAYGKDENIWGRWTGYRKSGHGGNKRLKECEPENLRFSILERVSPDMPADELQALEASWKRRLHTREFGLNDN